MVNIGKMVKKARMDIGLSQQRLASLSGVSLPTIQNIEYEQANPSWSVAQKILSALGYTVSINAKIIDWDKLISYGVPLSSEHKVKIHNYVDKLELIEHIAEVYTAYKDLDQRKKDAVEAFIIALKQHYPSFFCKMLEYYPAIAKMVPEHITARHIKLRRLALAVIGTYL